uniref:Truncated capsid protein n=1 Tax=Norovirus Hu/GII.4/HK/CU09N7/2009/CHN TaxID=664721 RepID=C7FHP5_NORV|nr:truncated capsid protein [Norovirus Hu/GII.4/HK/CU09N7/2009/CHN]
MKMASNDAHPSDGSAATSSQR